jgi:hypothetical protein
LAALIYLGCSGLLAGLGWGGQNLGGQNLGGACILHEPAGAERITAQFSFETIQNAGEKPRRSAKRETASRRHWLDLS